jgi:hypothetical protein
LNLREKDLFNSAFELLTDVLCEDLFRLPCVLETFVVVVYVKQYLILKVDQLIFVVHRLDVFMPFFLDLFHLFLLRHIHSLSDTLRSSPRTLTNSMKISPFSWSFITSASWLMNLKISDGNIEIKSDPSLKIYS